MKKKQKSIVNTISIGQGGVPKHSVNGLVKVVKEGIVGDRSENTKYHGGKDHPGQAICLYSMECYEKLKQEGISLKPGDLGENLTTQGLDYHVLKPGDILRVGNEVTLKVTKARRPCVTIGVAYDIRLLRLMWEKGFDHPTIKEFNNPKWGMSGFYAQVIVCGEVLQGDSIERIIAPKQVIYNARNK